MLPEDVQAVLPAVVAHRLERARSGAGRRRGRPSPREIVARGVPVPL